MEMRLLFDSSEHDQILFCRDKDVGLNAVIALHDVRAGLAMGGTRIRPYANLHAAAYDALSLSRHMSYKARCAGLPIGGAKGVIIGDLSNKTPELLASYAGFVDRLNGLFVTGQDMNMTCEDVQFLRSQTPYIAGDMPGTAGPSLMTALGVYSGMKAAMAARFGSSDVQGRTVAVQGVGATGQELCRLLSHAGARLVVCDVDPAKTQLMVDLYGATVVDTTAIFSVECDVLAPCAAGRVIDAHVIETLQAKIIAGSANNQLVDEEIHAEMLRKRGVLFCPDFVVNAGGLIEVYNERAGYDLQTVKDKVQGIAGTVTQLIEAADAQSLSVLAVARVFADARRPSPKTKAPRVETERAASIG